MVSRARAALPERTTMHERWSGALGAVGLAVALLLPGGAQAGRVVLVGIDGASWPVIDGMIAEGALPAYADLARRGVSAELATVEPVVSPVVWTSLATGRMPEAVSYTHLTLPTKRIV